MKKRKKRALPLVAPRHRMVLAADVWLKGRTRTAEAAEATRSGKTETSSACSAIGEAEGK